MKRRTFLQAASITAASSLLPLRALSARQAASPKKILVLGGTNFLGPAIVSRATRLGHDVTLFNRGITRPHLFPDIRKLRGRRAIEGSDLDALDTSEEWDAVIDVWPQHSSIVRQTAELLRDRARYYFFVSSIAVYQSFSQPGMTEVAPVRFEPANEYGAEKARTERLLGELYPGRFGVARCPAITGPYDPGASYHFWLRRLATRDRIVCPGDGSDPVQIVDSRDTANWILDSVETSRPGIHNITGPRQPVTLGEFLTRTRAGIQSNAELVWMDADFLRQDQGVRSFDMMPFWLPLDEDPGFCQIDGSKAINEGMSYRPVAKTATDTWRWFQSSFFDDTQFPANGWGISSRREDELLRAWDERA
jgi:2'-hydroxyisoflavone reductase